MLLSTSTRSTIQRLGKLLFIFIWMYESKESGESERVREKCIIQTGLERRRRRRRRWSLLYSNIITVAISFVHLTSSSKRFQRIPSTSILISSFFFVLFLLLFLPFLLHCFLFVWFLFCFVYTKSIRTIFFVVVCLMHSFLDSNLVRKQLNYKTKDCSSSTRL